MGSPHEQNYTSARGIHRIEDDLVGTEAEDFTKGEWYKLLVDEVMSEVKVIQAEDEISQRNHDMFREFLQTNGYELDASDY